MIHEIFVLLRTALAAKGCPFVPTYGPTPVPDTVGGTRIELFRDYVAGEEIAAATSQRMNPKQAATRHMSAVVRIFARSTLKGAQRHDHERLADLLADMCIVALTKIVRNASTTGRITRGGFVADASPDGWAGVVYELRFTVARGVADKTFQGASATEYDAAFGPGATTLSLDGADASPGLPTATTRVSE